MPEKPSKKTSSAGRSAAGAKSTTQKRAAKSSPSMPPWGFRRSTAPADQGFAAMAAFGGPPGPPVPPLPQPARGDHINLGVVAGSDGPTARLSAGATDLCEIAPSGEVALAGDTFRGNRAFDGDWSPSLGLHVKPGTLQSKVEFDSSFGWCSLYAEGWPPGGSQLPAGTVRVQGNDYALITRTVNDLQPVDSRLVRINPGGAGWQTVPGSLRNANWEGFNQTQISGCEAPDGWVYIVADGFARDHTVRLYHCQSQHFEDRNMWWAWGVRDGQWQWNVEPEPLSDFLFGELSLRLIEEKFVLSGFNQTTGQTEVRVADKVEEVLAPWTPVTVVVNQRELPRNYGGYIVPGSTLDQALILVSQWGEGNYPYNVQEFVVNLHR